MTTTKTLREGSADKRDAILSSARELFLAGGFERASMDSIASAAGVSKRTVYDYYGDKRTLLLAVVEQTIDALISAVQRAINENLTQVDDLQTSLNGFAQGITDYAIGSSDYAALMRLLSMESVNLPELREKRWVAQEPEGLLAERFAELGRRGLLDVPNPRLAADHFVALTLTSTANSIGRTIGPDETDTKQMIVDGVGAFLRAYGPRRAR